MIGGASVPHIDKDELDIDITLHSEVWLYHLKNHCFNLSPLWSLNRIETVRVPPAL